MAGGWDELRGGRGASGKRHNTHQLMRRWLLLLFLATMAIDWPQLPFNARVTDAAFVAAAIAILASAGSWAIPRLTTLDIAVIAYIAGSLPAVFTSPDLRASSIELVRQLYLVDIYIVIALAVRQGFTGTVASGLALSGGVLATLGVIAITVQAIFGAGLVAIGRVMTLPYFGDTLRLRALTASEAMLACVLAMSAPFVLLHPAIRPAPLRRTIAAMVLSIAALLTFSHSFAGFATAVLVVMWPSIQVKPIRIAAAAAVTLVILAANFAAAVSIRSVGTAPFRDDTTYHYAVDGGRTEIAGVAVEYQTMSYLRLKQVAWDAFAGRPVTGLGLDQFHAATEEAYRAGRLTEPYRAIDPHSTLPGRLAEAGVIGAISLLVLWTVAGVETLKLIAAPSSFSWVVTAVAAGLAGTLINSINADVMNFRFVWVGLGLVRGLAALTPKPD